MPAGSRTLLASGKRRISATGRRVLSNASGPCCCPACTYTECGNFPIACDCQAVVSGDETGVAVCCERNSGIASITFPAFTPATGWESEFYADTFADFMDEVSGQTLAFALDGKNRGYHFFKYGKITQISPDGCTAYAWRIEVLSYFDVPSGDMKFNIEVQFIGTDTAGPWTLGSNFPCSDNDGNPTGVFNPSVVPNQLLYMSVDATGNCDGPTENLVLDLIDTRYIEDGVYEVEPWDISSDCGPEDNSGYPASVDLDLSQFYSGLPVVTIPKDAPSGNSDLRYYLTDTGTVGDIQWDLANAIILPFPQAQTPDEGCDINNACCLQLIATLIVSDITDPENPIIILEQEVLAFKCDDISIVPGDYIQVPELGGGTVVVEATP